MTKTPRRLLILLLACALSPFAPAQTLARPGWAGSGMNTDPWWKHAVVYHVNPANFSPSEGSPLRGITERLDYLRSLGVDALLLTPIQPGSTQAQAIDPSLGTLDDLDDLIHQASRHNIRVLLDLAPGTEDLSTVARFWLNRGVAGLHLIGTTTSAPTVLQLAELRRASASYLGQRVIIGDFDRSTLAPTPQRGTSARSLLDAPQLLLDTRVGTVPQLSASTIRPAIDDAQSLIQAGRSMPLLFTDGPTYTRSMSRYADGQHDLAIAKVVATLLFTTGAASQIYYGQELGLTVESPPSTNSSSILIRWDAPFPPARGQPTRVYSPSATPNVAIEEADPTSLLNWYRSLSELHHGNATITSGTTISLNHDDQNVLAWVRKPRAVSTISPVVIVICNLSASPVHLSLKPDMLRLHLRGSFLRTLLRSDHGRGPMDLESTTLAPYAVYIGELRY
jgi:hypothetical protein